MVPENGFDERSVVGGVSEGSKGLRAQKVKGGQRVLEADER